MDRTASSQKSQRTRREVGASLLEYLLLVSLIAVAALGMVQVFGGATADNLSRSGEQIGAATSNP